MFYYVHYVDNWADEMELEGFALMDEKEYEHYTATVNAIIADIENGLPFVYQVGSNEDYFDSMKDSFELYNKCNNSKKYETVEAYILEDEKHFSIVSMWEV